MTDAHSAFDRDFVDDAQSHDAPLHHPPFDGLRMSGDGPPSRSGEDLQNTRTNPRQATSAVAFVGPLPEEDDPLLAFEPYRHSHPRKRSITPDVQRAFVAQLAATGVVKLAARHVGRSLEALYTLRHRPGAEGFAAAWDAALDRGVRRLEDCALERAIQGTRTPIVSGGKLLGWHDKPDNTLLRFLLNARLPRRYGAQRPEALAPGHPTYDRIAAEALEAERKRQASYEYEDEILQSIDRKLEAMRQRRIAMRAKAAAEAGETQGAEGEPAALPAPAPDPDPAEDRPRGPRVTVM